MTDPELIRNLSRGDDQAWRHLITTYGGLIFAAAKRVGLSESDREEVLQNTCLAALSGLDSLRDPDRLGSWLYSIAYRLGLNIVRKRRPELLVEEIGEHLSPDRAHASPTVQEALEAFEDARRIRDAAGRLDGRCHQLILALYLEDPPLSYDEISRRHGMPIGSIGPTRARCLKKLEEILQAVSEDDPGRTTG